MPRRCACSRSKIAGRAQRAGSGRACSWSDSATRPGCRRAHTDDVRPRQDGAPRRTTCADREKASRTATRGCARAGMTSIAESGIFKVEDLTMPNELDELEQEAAPAASAPEQAPTGTPDKSEPPAPIRRRTRSTRRPAKREQFLDLARSGERDCARAARPLLGRRATAPPATSRHGRSKAAVSPRSTCLTLALWSSDVEGRRYVIRALARIGTARARQSAPAGVVARRPKRPTTIWSAWKR